MHKVLSGFISKTCFEFAGNKDVACCYRLDLANTADNNSNCFSDLLPTWSWNVVNSDTIPICYI